MLRVVVPEQEHQLLGISTAWLGCLWLSGINEGVERCHLADCRELAALLVHHGNWGWGNYLPRT